MLASIKKREKNILLLFFLLMIVGGILRIFSSSSIDISPVETKEKKEISADFDNEKINQAWIEEQSKIHYRNQEEITEFLLELKQRFPLEKDRLWVISFLRLGTPYKLGCLGEESGIDLDPIFRLDFTDCTAFVLTNTALLCSQSAEEASAKMAQINYRSDDISFYNRLHFTTDRNKVSLFFKDVTEQLIDPELIEEAEIILNKKGNEGKRIVDIDWEKQEVLKYIPIEYCQGGNFLETLPFALGVAFVREATIEQGLDVVHEGFLFEGEKFIHASSLKGEVIQVSFQDYLIQQGSKHFDGVIFFEVFCPSEDLRELSGRR